MLFPHTLGIVTILKNEAPYVKEWLDYHLNAGADIVYLYDNDSEDNLEEIVSPYIKNGRVAYRKFPGDAPQLRCYHDAIIKHRFSCKYLAFINADEFIYPADNGSIKDFAEIFFAGKENLAGLYMYWRCFVSDNAKKSDLSKGVLERFQKRSDFPSKYGKTILNPRKVFDFISPTRSPLAFTNCVSLNEAKVDAYAENETYPADKIFVARFDETSAEESVKRKSIGNAFDEPNTDENSSGALFNSADQDFVDDNRLYEYYLSNLKNPFPTTTEKIEDCKKNSLEALSKNELNFEDFFGAIHILNETKYFTEKVNPKERKNLLREAYFNAAKNANETYMDLFFEELPFLIGLNIIEREVLTKSACKYYEHLQITLLSAKKYHTASRLREIWKYLEIM